MGNISVSSLTVGELAANCWFLTNEDTKEALVIDPGDEADRIQAYLEKKGWTVPAILLTHGHLDHMGAADALKERIGAPILAMKAEEPLLSDGKKNLSAFIIHRAVTVKADRLLEDGEELELAGIRLKVYLTPGHTPGGGSFYCEEAGCVFTGDTLFCGSVGRSDFPGGSMKALVQSIKEKLFSLPDNTRVCPGHGQETTVQYEKKYNPFVR